MNNSQNQQVTGGSELNQTQSLQQTTPSQNLIAPTANLQTSTNDLFSQANLKITQVNNTPLSQLTQQASTQDNSSSISIAPLVIGGAIILAIWAAVIIYTIKRGKSTDKKVD